MNRGLEKKSQSFILPQISLLFFLSKFGNLDRGKEEQKVFLSVEGNFMQKGTKVSYFVDFSI